MTDLENPTLDENGNPTVETQGNKNEEKKFSQAELDKVVQERIKREKESTRKQKEDFDSKEKEYQENISKLEVILEKQVEALSKDLPESTKKLLSKLTVLEQLSWLSEEGNVQKRQIPTTPKPEEIKKIVETKKVGKLF